jgi:teichoic acid transport system permease protein
MAPRTVNSQSPNPPTAPDAAEAGVTTPDASPVAILALEAAESDPEPADAAGADPVASAEPAGDGPAANAKAAGVGPVANTDAAGTAASAGPTEPAASAEAGAASSTKTADPVAPRPAEASTAAPAAGVEPVPTAASADAARAASAEPGGPGFTEPTASAGAAEAAATSSREPASPPTRARPGTAAPAARAVPLDPREHHVFLSRKSGTPKLRVYLPELWARREFVYELARCTLRAQNYLNAFGQLWLILNPLLLGCVYYVLVDIISNGKHASNYFAMLLAGLFLFTFFSSMLSQSAGSIIGSSRLVLNSRLPRLVLPITQIVIAFMRFLPCLLVFLVVHTIEGLPWGVNALYALPAFVEVAMFGAGLGFICATLQVYFRDFSNLLPYVTRIWLFLSPVLWELQTEIAHHDLKAHVIALNPLSPMIGSWGDALVYNVTPAYSWMLQGLGWSLTALVVGVLVFIRREREFSVRL